MIKVRRSVAFGFILLYHVHSIVCRHDYRWKQSIGLIVLTWSLQVMYGLLVNRHASSDFTLGITVQQHWCSLFFRDDATFFAQPPQLLIRNRLFEFSWTPICDDLLIFFVVQFVLSEKLLKCWDIWFDISGTQNYVILNELRYADFLLIQDAVLTYHPLARIVVLLTWLFRTYFEDTLLNAFYTV